MAKVSDFSSGSGAAPPTPQLKTWPRHHSGFLTPGGGYPKGLLLNPIPGFLQPTFPHEALGVDYSSRHIHTELEVRVWAAAVSDLLLESLMVNGSAFPEYDTPRPVYAIDVRTSPEDSSRSLLFWRNKPYYRRSHAHVPWSFQGFTGRYPDHVR